MLNVAIWRSGEKLMETLLAGKKLMENVAIWREAYGKRCMRSA